MKKLLNILYITTPESYLALDGENVVVRRDDKITGRYPLHALEGIVCFTYAGASPALMGACAEQKVDISFLTPNGRFLARVVGPVHGSILTRKVQYRWAEDEARCLEMSKYFIAGKLYNTRWQVERMIRDHKERLDVEKFRNVSLKLDLYMKKAGECTCMEELRGLEAVGAAAYFGIFDDMILGDKKSFSFDGRNRRPPTDNVNALLSFCYTLLAREMTSAIESVGLDPYAGFMHTDRCGRASLALDMMEELRVVLADRFVLKLINRRMLNPREFSHKEDGAVMMSDSLRRDVLNEWQAQKKEELTHPFLHEKVSWGLVPYASALLMNRYLRGDLDGYPPFMWK